MPGERDHLPDPPATADEGIEPSYTFAELQAELRRINDENRPLLKSNEFTIRIYSEATGLTMKESENAVHYMVSIGRITAVGKRFDNGHLRSAFRINKKEKNQ